jgi:menaquinone-dependent protoporphyrinogen oxidase
MNGKTLVAYASQGGATQGIAETVGQVLTARGAAVTLLPVTQVNDLSPYQSVVIGSAVHSGKWLPEARAFVERHQNTLRRMPTAVFQVCLMLATSNEQYKRMVPGWLSPLRAQIRPCADASFAGALWPERYPKFTDRLGLRIFLSVIHLKAGDYRDWNAVRSWAEQIYPLL